MENIKEIEKLLEKWKAVKKDAGLSGGIKERPFTQGVIFGLKTALDIINRPLNKKIEHGQTKIISCTLCGKKEIGWVCKECASKMPEG